MCLAKSESLPSLLTVVVVMLTCVPLFGVDLRMPLQWSVALSYTRHSDLKGKDQSAHSNRVFKFNGGFWGLGILWVEIINLLVICRYPARQSAGSGVAVWFLETFNPGDPGNHVT